MPLTQDAVPSSHTGVPNVDESAVRGSGKYKLLGVISHMGKNTEHGHYVCHVLRDGKWALFNDDKVASKLLLLKYLN